MKTSLFLSSLFAASWLTAANLVVLHGNVKAHTEVFGDSEIDPVTTSITSHLTMENTIESISGSITVSVSALKSDNEDRDEHMVETLESTKYPEATYTFKNVLKTETGYTIEGIMYFHGVSKPLSVNALFLERADNVMLRGSTSFLMTEFDVEPPTLLFLTVRDQIDLSIDITFEKQ